MSETVEETDEPFPKKVQVVMGMFDVEVLSKENHIESRKLWEQVFSEDSAAFLDAYYSGKGATNEIDVIRDDNGEICSMIQWNPVELMIGNQKRTVDYLVAVATREDMRRKGLMAQIMKAGLKKRKEQGMPFVFLTPANEAYYEPFGFITVGQSYQCQLKDISVDEFQKLIPNEDVDLQVASVDVDLQVTSVDDCTQENKYEVRILRKEEYDKAAQWVNACLSKQYYIFAARSKRYFQTLQKELASEGGDIVGLFSEGNIIGVFIYTMSGGLEIREPICEPEDVPKVYRAMKDFFGEKTEKGIIIGCRKEIKNTIVCAKTMVHILNPEECEGILSNVYLNEVV